MAAQKTAHGDGLVQNKQKNHHWDEASSQVGVLAQTQGQAGQHKMAGMAPIEASQQQIGNENLEKWWHQLVPAPAAHMNVPPSRRQKKKTQQRRPAAKSLPGQGIDARHREQAGEDRGQFQRKKTHAHQPEQPGHVIGVKSGRLEPTGRKRRDLRAVQDLEGIYGSVRLVDENPRRQIVDAVDAQKSGQQKNGDDKGYL